LAHRPHDTALRLTAKQALKFPAVHFTGLQARAVGQGFRQSVGRGGLTVWACSILPEHVHLVLARHTCSVERIVNKLTGADTEARGATNLRPLAELQRPDGRLPKCWARGEWKAFLDSDEAVRRAIRYVEQNPLKEGKPAQHWSFVTPYAPGPPESV